ncbi:hydroxymethylglutaryl-CoA lyase [Pelagibius sp.]|uniref:hydroxymethylglutaryl-CoA lyase n=1 Tax=Pelagibius sp. TaxID=1931238 RepID=UPI003BAE8937
MSERIVVSECFARDGLQNEPDIVSTETKVALIDRFSRLGLPRIEATSYSNPKVVPQFSDASEVLAKITRRDDAHYKATCANLRAVERANADHDAGKGVNEISLLASATESHSQKNLRATKDEQWQRIAEMVSAAGSRYRLIGSLSVTFGCPFEGAVEPGVVVDDCIRFAELGIQHVSLGDTTGLATPWSVDALFERIGKAAPDVTLIAHFHDSRGTGLANCVAAYGAGCRWFDSSFGGAGGHPAKIKYGGGHTGNVATEDLINLFEAMGVQTSVDLDGLLDVAQFCEGTLGRQLNGKTLRTGLSPLIRGETG